MQGIFILIMLLAPRHTHCHSTWRFCSVGELFRSEREREREREIEREREREREGERQREKERERKKERRKRFIWRVTGRDLREENTENSYFTHLSWSLSDRQEREL